MNELIEFAVFLTGHDRGTVLQMYNDWVKYKKHDKRPGKTNQRTAKD